MLREREIKRYSPSRERRAGETERGRRRGIKIGSRRDEQFVGGKGVVRFNLWERACTGVAKDFNCCWTFYAAGFAGSLAEGGGGGESFSKDAGVST